ncbi:MAG: FAD-dependent oxidoreductase, partial [Candidatus Marinimicrobia bacterium]|nr:FAD-dependent oxidoreductase [Candidatus Neomarinimicrobiota bacterium]
DSLKAKLCVPGRAQLAAYLISNNLPYRQCGKYVLAPDEQVAELEQLYRQGLTNGVNDLDLVDGDYLHRLYPELAAMPALYSSNTGILSVDSLLHQLAGEFQAHGGDLAVQTVFHSMHRNNTGYDVTLTDIEGEEITVSAAHVINAAGLGALDVARKAGFITRYKDYELRYCKGSYFKAPDARGAFKHLIYPLPTINSLGIHIRIDLQDEVRIGPDANYLATNEEDYSVDPESEQAFREYVELYWPGVAGHQLTIDWAGIRPHIFVAGEFSHDFQVNDENESGCPGWVNMLGIDSPGLTAAPAFGPHIAELWGL